MGHKFHEGISISTDTLIQQKIFLPYGPLSHVVFYQKNSKVKRFPIALWSATETMNQPMHFFVLANDGVLPWDSTGSLFHLDVHMKNP